MTRRFHVPRTRACAAAGILLLALAGMAACRYVAPPPQTYFARIERIDERAGDHFSPTRGHVPLLQIHVRLDRPDAQERDTRLTILVLGYYDPGRLGKAGDPISFRFAGDLPLSGEIWFEQLLDYTVLGPAAAVGPNRGRRRPDPAG